MATSTALEVQPKVSLGELLSTRQYDRRAS